MTNQKPQMPKELERDLKQLVNRSKLTVPRSAVLHEGAVTLAIIPHSLDDDPGYFDISLKVVPEDRELTPLLEGTRFQLNRPNQTAALLSETLDQWGQATFHRLSAGDYQLAAPALVKPGVLDWLTDLASSLVGAQAVTTPIPKLALGKANASSGNSSSGPVYAGGKDDASDITELTDGPFTFTRLEAVDNQILVVVTTDQPEWEMKLLALKVQLEKESVGVLVPLHWSEIHARYWGDFFIEATKFAIETTEKGNPCEPVSEETLANADLTRVEPIIEASIQRAGWFTRRTWRKIADLEGMPGWVKNAIIQTLTKIE